MTQSRIAELVAAFILVAMLGAPVLAAAEGIFKAGLTGFQEPPAISTEATGEFRAKISDDETSIEYELSYENLEGTVRQAHIHLGQFSVNGGIVVFLCQTASNPDPTNLAPTCPQSGQVSGTITAANVIGPAGQGIAGSPSGTSPEEFAEFVNALRARVTYANVHTTLHLGGEIRGQIRRGRAAKD